MKFIFNKIIKPVLLFIYLLFKNLLIFIYQVILIVILKPIYGIFEFIILIFKWLW